MDMGNVRVRVLGPGGPGKAGEYLVLTAEEARAGVEAGWARILGATPGSKGGGPMTPQGPLETKEGGKPWES